MYAGRIISHYAINNGHISEIYFYRPSYLLQKSVDMLLHVTADKLICADNNPQWVAIGISFYKSDNFSFVYNCVFQIVDSFVSMGEITRPKHIVICDQTFILP
jgi:hypothetical protein